MRYPGQVATAARPLSDQRRRVARRVAEAHRGLVAGPLLSFVSGSTVENLADHRSDVDMSVALPTLPPGPVLEAACGRAGGTPWFWTAGAPDDENGTVVAFHIDGIEVQIGYSTHAALARDMDELLLRHNPDTPLHKLAEGILKAEPLAGAAELALLQARLAAFPPELARAMVEFWLKTPTPWRAITQILHRDAQLWCRELLVEACYRQLGMLCGLNRRYFTRFQVKRMGRLAAGFAIAPPRLAERIDALLAAPAPAAFAELHALEGEVLDLVARHRPEVDVAAARQRRTAFVPDPGATSTTREPGREPQR